jgi:o-succinylbenzoate---CoA ligase
MVIRGLSPVPAPTGPQALGLLPALRAALSGSGESLLLYSPSEPPSPFAQGNSVSPGSPMRLSPVDEFDDDPDDPTAVLLRTSGSTGPPKEVMLTASALFTSASATHDRLGGPGHWLLALPVHHVAGVQVLVRSLLTGRPPHVMDLSAGFRVHDFTQAVAAMRGPRRYTALVPTQLHRILDGGPDAVDALRALDAVLVGGAATPPRLLERAREVGAHVVTTYGMTETCSGCVYDGVPLDGVTVETETEDGVTAPAGTRSPGTGRIRLGGPTLARGYRTGPDEAFHTDPSGRRWVRTDDLGTWDGAALVVRGRLDDVIVTGGLKVAPSAVESALADLPGVEQVVVCGVPDPQWGHRVVAVLVPSGPEPPGLERVRTHVASLLGRHAAPRQVIARETLPLLPSGKPDRIRIAAIAAAEPSAPDRRNVP